jgi:Methylamine utilisation protein MauE/AhpC/TSA family
LILLVARIIVGCVLAVAGVAKLADLSGARAGLSEFGVTRRLVGPASVALPIAELAVAGLLIPASTATAAAVAATGLLLVFAAAIGIQLARGRRPDCNCFGRVGSTAAGWQSLLRNLVLAAVAATVAIAGPGETIGQALGGVAPAVIVVVAMLIVVIGGLGWFNFQLFAQNARLLERVTRLEQGEAAGLPAGPATSPSVGAPAPDFALPDLVGRRWSLSDLLTPGRALALVFLDPGCPVCWQIVPGLERIAAARAGDLELAIITRGVAADVITRLDPGYAGPVLLQNAREVAERFGAVGVPSAVMIDHQGRISAPAVFGVAEIERLLTGPAVDDEVSLDVIR